MTDQVWVTLPGHDRHDGGDQRRRAHQRERDPPELLPARGAVDLRGLVDLLGDRGQAAQEQQEGEAEVLPDVHEYDHDHRPVRRGQPRNFGHAEQVEDVVDQITSSAVFGTILVRRKRKIQ